jgi:hypothetical protein
VTIEIDTEVVRLRVRAAVLRASVIDAGSLFMDVPFADLR